MATYHTCGGTYGIEEYIVANGCDISKILVPISEGENIEPWDERRRLEIV